MGPVGQTGTKCGWPRCSPRCPCPHGDQATRVNQTAARGSRTCLPRQTHPCRCRPATTSRCRRPQRPPTWSRAECAAADPYDPLRWVRCRRNRRQTNQRRRGIHREANSAARVCPARDDTNRRAIDPAGPERRHQRRHATTARRPPGHAHRETGIRCPRLRWGRSKPLVQAQR